MALQGSVAGEEEEEEEEEEEGEEEGALSKAAEEEALCVRLSIDVLLLSLSDPRAAVARAAARGLPAIY